jgi:hypothetical protein
MILSHFILTIAIAIVVVAVATAVVLKQEISAKQLTNKPSQRVKEE